MNKLKINTSVLFCFITALQLTLLIYFGYKKEGFFIDELWSYNLSNSYFLPFIGDAKNYFNRWIPGTFFLDSLEVLPGQGFSYNSVFSSQAADVHPPLYYYLLHTICSILPESFSKWQGLFLNFIIFIGSQTLLWKISNILLKRSTLSLLAITFYGFSISGLSTYLMIRMYGLLTFFVLLITYLILLFDKKNKDHLTLCVGICFAYFCGFLTQYYFVIFAFWISAFYCILLIFIHAYKKLIIFVLSSTSGIILSLVYFRPALLHIFSGYRGNEAFANLSNTGILEKLNFYFRAELLQSPFWLLFGSCALFVICIIFRKLITLKYDVLHSRLAITVTFNPNISFSISYNWILLGLISLACLFSYLLVIKLSSIRDTRYTLFVIPLLDVIAIAIFYQLAVLILRNSKSVYIVLILFFIIFEIISLRTSHIKWIQKGEQAAIECVNSSPGSKTLYFDKNEEWWPAMAFLNFFANSKEVKMLNATDINSVKLAQDEKRLFVIVSRFCNKKDVLDYFRNKLNFTKVKVIYRDFHGQVYELSR